MTIGIDTRYVNRVKKRWLIEVPDSFADTYPELEEEWEVINVKTGKSQTQRTVRTLRLFPSVRPENNFLSGGEPGYEFVGSKISFKPSKVTKVWSVTIADQRAVIFDALEKLQKIADSSVYRQNGKQIPIRLWDFVHPEESGRALARNYLGIEAYTARFGMFVNILPNGEFLGINGEGKSLYIRDGFTFKFIEAKVR